MYIFYIVLWVKISFGMFVGIVVIFGYILKWMKIKYYYLIYCVIILYVDWDFLIVYCWFFLGCEVDWLFFNDCDVDFVEVFFLYIYKVLFLEKDEGGEGEV